jgi:hypothetical protein
MLRRLKTKFAKKQAEPTPADVGQHTPEGPVQMDTFFKYSPLKDANDTIRLLRIKSVEEPSDAALAPLLEIELFHVPLASAKDYIAISYAWGDPAPVRTLLCDGQEIHVPENTFRVLYTLQHCATRDSTQLYQKGETLTLWIDAICINQKDIAEKNCQVPLMGSIYRQARGAVGYVGSPSEGIDPNNAIHSMAWWANCPILKPPPDLTTDQSDPSFKAWLAQAQKAGVGEPPASLGRDMTDLWSSEWFVRCWVTQEMVLPEKVVCMYGYGSKACTWNLDMLTIMIDRAQNVETAHHDAYKISKEFDIQLLQKAIHVDAWRVMREELRKDGSIKDLIQLLHRSRRTKATDQRDIIYSLFGLMKDEERAAIRVDYSPSHTARDVFMDVARYCIQGQRGANLLVEAGLSRSIPHLPSWVPDWTIMSCTPLNTGIYNACSNLSKPLELLANSTSIAVTGKRVEAVAHVGIAVNYPYGVLELDGCDPPATPYSLSAIITATAIECEIARKVYPAYPLRQEDWSEVLRRTCAVDRHWSGRRLAPADRRDFDTCIAAAGFGYDVFEAIKEDGDAVPISPLDERSKQVNALPYGIVVSEFQKGRVMGLLKGGLLACMPRETRVGDIVVVLFGGWVPYVLRPLDVEGEFELVGHCYVHGIMDGEWIEATLASIPDPTDFVLEDVFERFVIQ